MPVRVKSSSSPEPSSYVRYTSVSTAAAERAAIKATFFGVKLSKPYIQMRDEAMNAEPAVILIYMSMMSSESV